LILSAAETAAKLGTEVYTGALWDRRAGTIQPLGYARGLARAALQAGARLYTRSPVLSASHEHGAWTVRTDRGAAKAQWIVVATDAYSTGPWARIDQEQIHLPISIYRRPRSMNDPWRRFCRAQGAGTHKEYFARSAGPLGPLIFGAWAPQRREDMCIRPGPTGAAENTPQRAPSPGRVVRNDRHDRRQAAAFTSGRNAVSFSGYSVE
jgi:glycine/D-amino acid oxidase-like deaminating enzyme